MTTAEATRKRRSGSESRQRTYALTLRLLPGEAAELTLLAKQHGHPSRQALIRDAVRRLVAESHPTDHPKPIK